MESFIFSLNATVPVFAIMVMGYIFRKIGWLNEAFCDVANKFVFQVCLPCMLFLDLADTDILHHFDGAYIGFCAAVTLISIFAIWGLAKLFMPDKSMVGAFVQCAYRSSAAILGVAFIQNIYGDAGMAPLMIIGSVPLYNIFAVMILTLESNDEKLRGSREGIKLTCINILKNPIILGIVAGLLASMLQLKLPHMVAKTLEYMGNMTSPLALLAIGATFEGAKAIKKIKPTLVATGIKLIGLTAIFLPIAIWFGFTDQKLLALVIMLGSPTTATAYIMAKSMHGDEVLSSSVIVMTTLCSAITLTGWIFILRYLGLLAG